MKPLDLIERRKARGRPFVKGNVKGKPPEELMIEDTQEKEEAICAVEDEFTKETSFEKITHSIPPSQPKKRQKKESKQTELKKEDNEVNLNSELVESLDFFDGENKLSIRLLKTPNRLYKINVILNDKLEIRPTTYPGAVAGVSYWNLLKGFVGK